MNRTTRDPLDVLVVLPNWLGDVVMATPLLSRLAAAHDADGRPLTVAVSVRRRWAPLLQDDPRIRMLHRYERTGRHAGWAGAWRLARAWRELAPRSCVVCPPSFRTAIVARLARIPVRVGEAADGRAWLLTTAVPQVAPRGTLHHVDELLSLGDELLERLGARASGSGPGLPTLPGLATAQSLDPGDGPPIWVLAPGATYGSAKAWPPGRIAEFLQHAVMDRGRRVVVVGDSAGQAVVAAVREAVDGLPWRRDLAGPAGVIDLVDRTSLVDLAALLRCGEAFLGNDSGVMHLAAALGVPTVGLFGSSSVAWTAPRGARARALAAEGFPCQPCFRRTCNQETFCLDTLSGARVYAEVVALIEGATP